MKKTKYIFCVIVVLILVSCSTDSPENTIEEFLKAGKEFDFEKMNEYIDPSHEIDNDSIESIMNPKSMSEESVEQYFIEYFKDNAKKITYEITEVNTEGDEAQVKVNFKYVNGGVLIKTTLGEVFSQAFSMALSGVEMTEEEMNQLFLNIMQKQEEEIKESFAEKTIDIPLIKMDKKWYIKEVSDDLFDVLLSNFLQVADEIEADFASEESFDLDTDTQEVEETEEYITIEKEIDEEVILATIKLKVTGVEEQQVIEPEYGDPVQAKEGAKFVIVNVELTNITKETFTISPDLLIIDDQERQFEASDAIFVLDDYMDYRDLSPSIKEKGSWLYELPEDAQSYNLTVAKGGTNEVYMIHLK